MSAARYTPPLDGQLRLMTKVARMYHEQHIRQPEIAQRLHISQSRVSRLLKEAVNLGVVRTIVVTPPGVPHFIRDVQGQLVFMNLIFEREK